MWTHIHTVTDFILDSAAVQRSSGPGTLIFPPCERLIPVTGSLTQGRLSVQNQYPH